LKTVTPQPPLTRNPKTPREKERKKPYSSPASASQEKAHVYFYSCFKFYCTYRNIHIQLRESLVGTVESFSAPSFFCEPKGKSKKKDIYAILVFSLLAVAWLSYAAGALQPLGGGEGERELQLSKVS